MHFGFATRVVLGALLAGPAVAQQTWIVDAANGPGAHFTALAPAVAAAAGGDRVLVRSGVYDVSGTSSRSRCGSSRTRARR